MTVRVLLVLAAISFSATAFAQSAPPKIGNKPLVQVKPKEPMGCKLLGMVKGTRLWPGDCVASELRCGIRGKAATDSDGRRPSIPIESDHPIRTKAATLLIG
jgi:hypothetical protein